MLKGIKKMGWGLDLRHEDLFIAEKASSTDW